ncbi:MAG: hypothetical protein RMK31_08810 [Candidatus Caldarchaeum sp.]|nr:hypothetical protein [Candidatus Caldarchaeum sp.]
MAGKPVQTNQLSESTMLDYAAKIGVQAKKANLAKNQLEQLIASLENFDDERLCLLVTAAFAYRQVNRLAKDNRWKSEELHKTADLIAEAMTEIYDKNGKRQDARKVLGLAKWVFESVEGRNIRPVSGFNDYLKQMASGRDVR